MSERDGGISFRDYVVSNTHSNLQPESLQLDAMIPLEQNSEVVESNTEIPPEIEIKTESAPFEKITGSESQTPTFDANLSVSDFERVKPFHSTTSNAKWALLGIPLGIAIISFAFSFPLLFANTALTQQEYDNIMGFQGHMIVFGPLMVIASMRSLTRGCKFYLTSSGVLVRPYKLGLFKMDPVTGSTPKLVAFAKNRKNKTFSLVMWTGSEAFTLLNLGNRKVLEKFHSKVEESAAIELKWVDFKPDLKSKLERLATIIVIIFISALILFVIAIFYAHQNGEISQEQIGAIGDTILSITGEEESEIEDEGPVDEGSLPSWATDNIVLIAVLLFVIPIGFKLYVALRKMVKEPEVLRNRCLGVM
ncbi:hypothetical protein OAJ94_03970 [Deltaproteobacteria bacterium]|nr:hypothetical protein [Deltaproteobacteria bacterium]